MTVGDSSKRLSVASAAPLFALPLRMRSGEPLPCSTGLRSVRQSTDPARRASPNVKAQVCDLGLRGFPLPNGQFGLVTVTVIVPPVTWLVTVMTTP